MRRTASITLALALLALAPFAASAARLGGAVRGDERASVVLEVKRAAARAVVTRFTVKHFLLRCEGDTTARLDRATLTGRARVGASGRFRMKASTDTQRLLLRGRLRGRTARGVVEYSGRTEFATQTLDCHSGELRWTASR